MSHHIAYRNVKGLGKIPEMVTEYFNYLQQVKNSVGNFIRFYQKEKTNGANIHSR